MALIDVNKRSLPEQVQKNKDDIETLMVDPTTKQYVDDQDANVLQDAKDYTDDHTVDSDHINSGSATSGKILTADGDGGCAWDTPSTPTIKAANIDSETATSGQVLTADGNGDATWETPTTPTITAADVDSETATSGQVLTADGNGDAAWTTISAGGLTLVWSGALALEIGTSPTINVKLDPDKNYIAEFSASNNNTKATTAIINSNGSNVITYMAIPKFAFAQVAINWTSTTTAFNLAKICSIDNSGTVSVDTSSTGVKFKLLKVYEIN